MKKVIKVIFPLLIISIVGVVYYNLIQPTKIDYSVKKVDYYSEANFAPVYWDLEYGGLLTTLKLKIEDFSNIKKIVFNNISATGVEVTSDLSYDLSKDKDKSVIALIAEDTLYIQYNGILYLNEDSEYLFADIKVNYNTGYVAVSPVETSYLKSISGFEYIDTSRVTDMSGMFYGLKSLTELDLSSFDTSNVTTMSSMFSGMSSLTELDLSSFDTSNVTTMHSMFDDASSLTMLDLSSFNTSKVKEMWSMFEGMNSLKSLDLSSFNTSNVTSMGYMFNDMSSLTELNLSSFDTSNVTNMSGMFSGMSSLTELDLSSFDTSNVTNMSGMFSGASYLTELDLSSFDTSNVTNMSGMFSGMSSLTELDLSSFDTSNVTNMSSMFSRMSSLTELDLSSFDTCNVTTMGYMFNGVSALTELDLSSFDTSNVTNMVIMFGSMNSLTKLDLNSFDTTIVTDMGSMFNRMSSLTELDLSSFDTSNVTNMSDMFSGMSSLTKLDLSSFDTSNVTNMSSMFSSMNALTELNLSSFDTSNVTTMSTMFSGMSSLTKLDLSSFDTINVTSMSYMFNRMSSLTELDLSSFDTSNVTTMYSMFNGMSSLTELDLSSFDTSNVNEMWGMFMGVNSLTELDLSSFDTSNVRSMNNLFHDMRLLNKIIVSEKFVLDKVTSSFQMFKNTENLVGWNGTEYDSNYVSGEYARLDTPTTSGYFSAKLTSSEYLINNDENYYIYIGNNTITEDVANKLTTSYGEGKVENSKYNIYYEDELVKSFDIVNFESDKYDIKVEKGYMYTGADTNEQIILSNINLNNGQLSIKDNKLIIKYKDEMFESIDIVKVESEEYDLSKDYIYTGSNNINLNDINVINGFSELTDDNLIIKYNNETVKQYPIYSINLRQLSLKNKRIVILEEITYEDFISNITTNGVTYKIFNGEEEVTTGNITPGMNVNIYIGEELMDTYEIADEYLEISDNIKVNETASMIEDLTIGQTVEHLMSNIDTTGIVKVVDQENNEVTDTVGTGYKVIIELSKETIEYILVVSGDITGDGEIKMSDVMKAANQMIEENTIVGDCYLKAADVTGDGTIRMSDVMKLANYIIEGGSL